MATACACRLGLSPSGDEELSGVANDEHSAVHVDHATNMIEQRGENVGRQGPVVTVGG
jgi:hypothetical protein